MKDYIIKCTDEQGTFYIAGDTRFGYQTTDEVEQARVHKGNDLTFRNVSEYYKHLKPEKIEVITLSQALTTTINALEEYEIFIGFTRIKLDVIDAFLFNTVTNQPRSLRLTLDGIIEKEVITADIWEQAGADIVSKYFPEDHGTSDEIEVLQSLIRQIPNELVTVNRDKFEGWQFRLNKTILKTIVIKYRR